MTLLWDMSAFDMKTAGQILGFLLSLFNFFIFFGKTRRSILSAKLTCDVGYCIQQLMIGAPTGALLDLIATFRDVIFYYRQTKRWASHRFWLFLFLVLTGLSPVLTWTGPISLLPTTGSVISVFSFYCAKPLHIRQLGLLAAMPWLAYAVITSNYGLIFATFIQLFSIFLGLARDYRDWKATKADKV